MNVAESKAVKVVFEWRVLPGGGERFQRWIAQLAAHAAGAAGYEGSSVFSAQDEWLLLLRFADRDALTRWQAESRTAELLAACAPFAQGGQRQPQRSGLETWFHLPGHAAPPRWKMAIVTWCALLPQVLLLGEVMPASLPPLAQTALGTAIPVAMLTWVVMPLLTRLLAPWLFRRPAT
jgi:uncharacterized protein